MPRINRREFLQSGTAAAVAVWGLPSRWHWARSFAGASVPRSVKGWVMDLGALGRGGLVAAGSSSDGAFVWSWDPTKAVWDDLSAPEDAHVLTAVLAVDGVLWVGGARARIEVGGPIEVPVLPDPYDPMVDETALPTRSITPKRIVESACLWAQSGAGWEMVWSGGDHSRLVAAAGADGALFAGVQKDGDGADLRSVFVIAPGDGIDVTNYALDDLGLGAHGGVTAVAATAAGEVLGGIGMEQPWMSGLEAGSGRAGGGQGGPFRLPAGSEAALRDDGDGRMVMAGRPDSPVGNVSDAPGTQHQEYFRFDSSFYSVCQNWATDLDTFGRIYGGFGSLEYIVTAGTTRNDPSSEHYYSRAFDLDRVRWYGGYNCTPYVGAGGSGIRWQRCRYLAVDATTRRWARWTLDHWYNSDHENHIHFDTSATPVHISESSRSDTVFVQQTCNDFMSWGLVRDGIWGPNTEAAYQELKSRLAISGNPKTSSTWYRSMLHNIARKGFLDQSI